MDGKTEGNQLPHWFNVERYKALGGFNAAQWAIIQKNRAEAREFIARKQAGDTEAAALLDLHFSTIAIDPLLELDKKPYMHARAPDPLIGKPPEVIQPLTIGKTAQLVEEWRQQNSDQASLLDDLTRTLRNMPVVSISAAHFAVFEREVAPKLGIVEIDLKRNDRELEAAFKQWLASTRLRYAANSRTQRGGRFERWTSMGIIPYIDIMQWAEYTGVRITQRAIAERFSGHFLRSDSDLEQALSRTIAPEAEIFLSEEIRQQLV